MGLISRIAFVEPTFPRLSRFSRKDLAAFEGLHCFMRETAWLVGKNNDATGLEVEIVRGKMRLGGWREVVQHAEQAARNRQFCF
jgi:hypothetical protein